MGNIRGSARSKSQKFSAKRCEKVPESVVLLPDTDEVFVVKVTTTNGVSVWYLFRWRNLYCIGFYTLCERLPRWYIFNDTNIDWLPPRDQFDHDPRLGKGIFILKVNSNYDGLGKKGISLQLDHLDLYVEKLAYIRKLFRVDGKQEKLDEAPLKELKEGPLSFGPVVVSEPSRFLLYQKYMMESIGAPGLRVPEKYHMYFTKYSQFCCQIFLRKGFSPFTYDETLARISLFLGGDFMDKDMAGTVPQDARVVKHAEQTKRHISAVFIGHADAGKSTATAQILCLSGEVKEFQQYQGEAKAKSGENSYMAIAYIMDKNEEERTKGKSSEVRRAHFETNNTRFTILDAPGHKDYVPSMISGASQAEIGVLEEFEVGYERGGQTREHVLLAKALGLNLVVLINKMDDRTVQWSKERYDEIEGKMATLLKSSGYNVKKAIQFLPISGLTGSNIKIRVEKSTCSWWEGPCLFGVLDRIDVPFRNPNGPVRMPVLDKYKDMGTVVMGKLESGSITEGDSLLVMPTRTNVKVIGISLADKKVCRAGPAEHVGVKLSGIEEEHIMAGFVLSSVANHVGAITEFQADLEILYLNDNAIFTKGYKAMLHLQYVVEECEIIDLIEKVNVKNGAVVVCRIQVSNLICVEKFSDLPQLGRFTLRTEGKTVAVGKIVDLPPAGRTSFAECGR